MLTINDRVDNILKKIPDATPFAVAIALRVNKVKAARLLRLRRIATGSEVVCHSGKADQIHRILKGRKNLDIYESNGERGTSGEPGHCSLAYAKHGNVTSMWTKDGDIMDTTYQLLLSKKLQDVIDLDPWLEAMDPLGAGILRALKPRGLLFLTWGPDSQFRRWIAARARSVCYNGREMLDGESRNKVVVREALRVGRTAKLIEEIRFDNMLRQVWDIRQIMTTTYRKTREDLQTVKDIAAATGLWAPMNVVADMKKAVHEA